LEVFIRLVERGQRKAYSAALKAADLVMENEISKGSGLIYSKAYYLLRLTSGLDQEKDRTFDLFD
jgi:hypothetical protein